MGTQKHFAEMTFGLANAQDDVTSSKKLVQLVQHLGGVDIHIHDGLGIYEEEGDRGLECGLLDYLLNPVGKIGGIKKEERPGKPVDQEIRHTGGAGDDLMGPGQSVHN
jgi:hypothetical protein